MDKSSGDEDDEKEEDGSDDDDKDWKPEEKGHALMKDTILSDDESDTGKDVPFLNGNDSSLSFSTGDEDEKDDEETEIKHKDSQNKIQHIESILKELILEVRELKDKK